MCWNVSSEAPRHMVRVGLTHEEAAEFVEMAGLFANTMELTKLASREFSRGLGNYRMIMKGDPDLVAGLMSGKASGM